MNKFDIIEKFRSIREGNGKNAFSSWTEVYSQMKLFDPNDGNYYIFSTSKGTEHESRTRFLTYSEAIDFIQRQINGQR